jgi:hypothetical protein
VQLALRAEEGLSLNDYVRGIVFSINRKLNQEDAAEYERHAKIRHENRKYAKFR